MTHESYYIYVLCTYNIFGLLTQSCECVLIVLTAGEADVCDASRHGNPWRQLVDYERHFCYFSARLIHGAYNADIPVS